MSSIIIPGAASQITPEQLFFADTPDAFLAWLNSPDGNPNALGDDGVTPLMVLAVEQRHTMGLACLLDKGAKLSAHTAMIKERKLDALALLLLVQLGNIDEFTALLVAGADVNVKMKMGPLPVPNFLLKRVDEKIVESPLLHVLVESPDPTFVSAALTHGADVNAVDSEENTALHVAATKPAATREGQFPIIDLLLEHKANLTMKNRQGYTPVEHMVAFFSAVSPELLTHPLIQKMKNAITPEGGGSSIILLP